jgi:hypothetical protein
MFDQIKEKIIKNGDVRSNETHEKGIMGPTTVFEYFLRLLSLSIGFTIPHEMSNELIVLETVKNLSK